MQALCLFGAQIANLPFERDERTYKKDIRKRNLRPTNNMLSHGNEYYSNGQIASM